MVQEGELALIDSLVVKPEIEMADSVEPEPHYALIYLAPSLPEEAPLRNNTREGVSFILSALFILFLAIALRFRNNMKYVAAIFRNLIETRTRQNVFDDTVRETSLIVLLNILWCACVGIIGSCCMVFSPMASLWPASQTTGMLIGMAMALCYTIFMYLAYYSVGWVFSDSEHAVVWLKGYGASQALMAPFFFILALLAVCLSEAELTVAIITVLIFILCRLFFITKGFKIFFSQFSSWVLFLCYLCSLEIIPLVLTYRLALLISGQIG